MKNLILPLTLILACFQIGLSQQNYKISPENPVKVSVKGLSTLHDWEAVASIVSDYPQTISKDLTILDKGLMVFGFKVQCESLDGGRGASMNNKIKKALKSEEHPYITFTQSSLESLLENDEGDFVMTSTGTVEIAGVTKEIVVKTKVDEEGGDFIISGEHALKMSDFNIEPPTAMFGQIKTQDDITVHFEFRYIAQ